jgi:hypothetical protein
MKLGIIVPYRKRPGHLRKFRQSISEYLKDEQYELIVVEQADDLPIEKYLTLTSVVLLCFQVLLLKE